MSSIRDSGPPSFMRFSRARRRAHLPRRAMSSMPARWSRESPAPAPARAPSATSGSSSRIERTLRRVALAILLALIGSNASAELSATASVLSDYRYRGVSLSRGDPAAQLGLVWDDPSGGYAGLFASSV